MNEKKKSLIVLVVLLSILLIIIGAVIVSIIESNKKMDEIKDVLNSANPRIVYLSKPSCYYCNLIEPITTSLRDEYGLEYYHINTGNLSNSELNKVLGILEIDASIFGTPYIAIVQNGKVIDQHIGYTDENILFELFQKYNLIDSNESLHMNYIDTIDNVWNNENPTLLLIGQSGDTNSIEARLTLRNLAKEYSFEINYFDIALDETSKSSELLDTFGIEEFPVLINVQNGNILTKTAETDEKSYKLFLEENGYIK